MKEQIAKSVFWLVWSRGVVQVVTFLSTLVVARLLSPADYGLMALAGIWTYTISLLADLGLGPAIIQFRNLQERELNTCFWLTMAMAVGGYLGLCALAPVIAAWFATPPLTEILRVTGLSLPLVVTRIVPDGLLRRRLELDRVSQAEAAAALVTFPVVLGMAWSGAGVWALVAGVLVAPLVQNVATFWFVRWRPGLAVGSERLREILKFSLATLGARAGWAVFQQLDMFFLGKVSASSIVIGHYSMAKQIANLPGEKVSVALNQLASPVMAGLQGDPGAMRASLLRALRLSTCLIFPLCLGMALTADDLVRVALGAKWLPAVPVLRVLCFFGLIHSLDILLPPVLLARYRATFMFWWTVGLIVIMSFAFGAGAAWMGSLGVAFAWVTAYPLVTALMMREGLKELELHWTTLWRELRPVTDATLMMAAAVIAVRWVLPTSGPADGLLHLGLTVVLGAAVYGAAIMRRGGPLVDEIAEVAGWLLRRRTALDRVPSLRPRQPAHTMGTSDT